MGNKRRAWTWRTRKLLDDGLQTLLPAPIVPVLPLEVLEQLRLAVAAVVDVQLGEALARHGGQEADPVRHDLVVLEADADGPVVELGEFSVNLLRHAQHGSWPSHGVEDGRRRLHAVAGLHHLAAAAGDVLGVEVGLGELLLPAGLQDVRVLGPLAEVILVVPLGRRGLVLPVGEGAADPVEPHDLVVLRLEDEPVDVVADFAGEVEEVARLLAARGAAEREVLRRHDVAGYLGIRNELALQLVRHVIMDGPTRTKRGGGEERHDCNDSEVGACREEKG